jgi:hypothetical protein
MVGVKLWTLAMLTLTKLVNGWRSKKMKFSDFLSDQHFNNLAAIVRVAATSEQWRKNHADVPFWTLQETFSDLVFLPANGQEILVAFSDLVVTLVTADQRLFYTEADMKWFVSILDLDVAPRTAVLSLFCAWMVSPTVYLTPAEAASKYKLAESTWRNLAASGRIPGAIKKGKQWLLPEPIVRSRFK